MNGEVDECSVARKSVNCRVGKLRVVVTRYE